ncbi:hypothetical protein [Mesorhizobium sp. LNJC394B00]|uniref:hypothetical protein n=1 Tax=Mesorhizobium sp. LNJC394B00 TaxID=1287274 RepID=UPI0003CEE6CE|nr:hypothetical protein [Mesorhizobium sp. LNJC394B00]ESY15418.1 hypothetical protein X750_28665 [Mesorhizobium sp. LNJC394B00]
MNDLTLPLSGLSSVGGKSVVGLRRRNARALPSPNSTRASPSTASRGSRHSHRAQTPRTEPADRNLQTPPAITTDHRRRLTRFAKKHRNGGQIAASGRQELIAVHQRG